MQFVCYLYTDEQLLWQRTKFHVSQYNLDYLDNFHENRHSAALKTGTIYEVFIYQYR